MLRNRLGFVLALVAAIGLFPVGQTEAHLVPPIDVAQSVYQTDVIGDCPMFPPDNPWNRDISNDPVHPDSDAMIAAINRYSWNRHLRAGFGHWEFYGLPYLVVSGSEPKQDVEFFNWPEESDPGPYPIPPDAPVETGSADRHVIVVDKDNCMLYELFHAYWVGNRWMASSGAVFDLTSNHLRPYGWTSADAAGLPIFPGLVRYDEVQTGVIDHALRVLVARSAPSFVFPARHFQGNMSDPDLPPMGTRLRLKSDFDISGYTGHARIILEALKKYGMFVADNAHESWHISGTSSPFWNRQELETLRTVPGTAFEVVLPNYGVDTSKVTPEGGLSLQYRAADYGDKYQTKPHFRIVNKGFSRVTLKDLSIRYWFTWDGYQKMEFSCLYATMDCDNIKAYYVYLDKPLVDANVYLEIKFHKKAGFIEPYGSSGSIWTRNNSAWWTWLDKTNDYSYNGEMVNFAEWPRITMYYKGKLIWGQEPTSKEASSNSPPPTPTEPYVAPILTPTPIMADN